jgi:hypothetical protein
LEEHRDPITGALISRTVQLPEGLAVDLDCEEALFFGARFMPKPHAILDRPGKPQSRWLYRIAPDDGTESRQQRRQHERQQRKQGGRK